MLSATFGIYEFDTYIKKWYNSIHNVAYKNYMQINFFLYKICLGGLRLMKRIVSTVCAIMTMIIAATNTMVTTVASNRYVGDVNLDGYVDSTDASRILEEYTSISTGGQLTLALELADVNGDGFIDSADASRILEMYAAAATGENVDYKVISKPDDISIEINDLMEVAPIYLYTKPEATNENLYAEKNYLATGDRFVIVEVMSDKSNWYRIQLSFNQEEDIYVQLPGEILRKVGMVITDNHVSTTATSTAETTTTTTTTTTIPETSTETTATMLPVTTVTINPNVSVGSIVEFTGTSWYVHSKITENLSGDLYVNKPLLVKGDRFLVVQEQIGEWYAISFDNADGTPAYIRVSETSMSKYFEKVGESEKPEVITTTETTTTTTTTTSTTTTATTTTTSTPEEEPLTIQYKKWECLTYMGDEDYNIFSAPGESNEVIGTLKKGDYFFLKEGTIDNWYWIVSSNVDEGEQYIQIKDITKFGINDVPVYEYIGTGWNIRTSMSLYEDNVAKSLSFGDLFAVIGWYEDSWVMIASNKVSDLAFIKMENPSVFAEIKR